MRNYIVLVFLFCIFISAKKPVNQDLQVISAEKQTVYGGVYGSPIVTNYKIVLKSKRNFTIIVDSVYAEGKKDELKLLKDSFNHTKTLKLKKNQSLTMYFYISTVSDVPNQTNPQFSGSRTAASPIKITNEQALFYYKGGKSKYLIVSNIKKNETIFAP